MAVSSRQVMHPFGVEIWFASHALHFVESSSSRTNPGSQSVQTLSTTIWFRLHVRQDRKPSLLEIVINSMLAHDLHWLSTLTFKAFSNRSKNQKFGIFEIKNFEFFWNEKSEPWSSGHWTQPFSVLTLFTGQSLHSLGSFVESLTWPFGHLLHEFPSAISFCEHSLHSLWPSVLVNMNSSIEHVLQALLSATLSASHATQPSDDDISFNAHATHSSGLSSEYFLKWKEA